MHNMPLEPSRYALGSAATPLAQKRKIMKPRKEWRASFNGHEIRVIYTWINMIQLFIDGDCKDQLNVKAHLGFSEDVLLTSSISSEDGKRATVEIFVKPTFLSIEARICINGNEIGGEVVSGS
jgi:hypothetical protein